MPLSKNAQIAILVSVIAVVVIVAIVLFVIYFSKSSSSSSNPPNIAGAVVELVSQQAYPVPLSLLLSSTSSQSFIYLGDRSKAPQFGYWTVVVNGQYYSLTITLSGVTYALSTNITPNYTLVYIDLYNPMDVKQIFGLQYLKGQSSFVQGANLYGIINIYAAQALAAPLVSPNQPNFQPLRLNDISQQWGFRVVNASKK